MAFAGQLLAAGRIPGERIARTEVDSDSSAFSSETELISVAADLVSGRTYTVHFVAPVGRDNADCDRVIVRTMPNGVGGSVQTATNISIPTGSTAPFIAKLEVEWTAASTGTQTFVGTGQAFGSGSPQARLEASGSPAYLYVVYTRG